MASTSTPMIGLNEVKSLLPIRAGNAEFDARITSLVILATKQIEQATKRFFTSQVHVQYFAARDTSKSSINLVGSDSVAQASITDFHSSGVLNTVRPQTLTLQSFPVDTTPALLEVVYDPLQAFANNDTFAIIPATSYVLDEDNGRLHLRWPMHPGRRRIRVTFTGGFTAADTPATLSTDLAAQGFEDLRQACIIQTVFLFKKLDRENVGKKGDKQSGGSVVDFWKIGGLAPEAASMLTAYKSLLTGHR